MRVKTVATIGPASETHEIIESFIDSGLDIARFNFSHAKPDEVYSRAEKIRNLSQSKQKSVQILQDLCGRRIRLGEIEGGGRDIADGETVVFYTANAPEPASTEILIQDNYLHRDIKAGDTLLIESGKYQADVISVDPERQRITAQFGRGGRLLPRKGVNVPYVKLTAPALTDKDKADVELGKELGFEWIALSFVQSVDDISDLRKIALPQQKIIAKVEDPLGVKNIDEIITASDGIMVARGDLGVELPLEEIPFIQKEIVAKCRYANKPSIVATQMLLSMVYNPTPTRAEVSDVANAVIDGADAVMLSDETAAGDYPVEALKTLVKITERTERFLYDRPDHMG
jgi:pyruvate kinase